MIQGSGYLTLLKEWAKTSSGCIRCIEVDGTFIATAVGWNYVTSEEIQARAVSYTGRENALFILANTEAMKKVLTDFEQAGSLAGRSGGVMGRGDIP